ncbi:uncharacterized protein WM277_007431 isoform 1-T9 [Molossus nigricans]
MNAIRLNSAHLGSSSSKYLFGFRDKSFSNLLVEYRFGRKPRRSRTEVDGLNKAWVICSLQACSVSRTSEDFKRHLEICPGRGCGYNQVYPVFCVHAPGVLGPPDIPSILQKGARKACLPSVPMIPIPTYASCIMLTSLSPSPTANVTGFSGESMYTVFHCHKLCS